jgi:thiol-disulfide isomerase/thioredoxin
MKNIFKITLFLFLLTGLSACENKTNHELEQGIWRATLMTTSGAVIPFNFEVIDSANQKFLNVINGNERFRVNEISTVSDSIFIQMPLFDSEIRVKIRNGSLNGQWIKHFADSSEIMMFEAKKGYSWRFFKANTKPEFVVSGRWSAAFNDTKTGNVVQAIAEFTQKDGLIFGTFLTSTGDYRFLEGTVSDDKIYLSCFDGSHAYLFTGKILNKNSIVDGLFYSGLSSVKTWTAKRDDTAILPDAYSITSLKDGFDKIDFSFPDLNGKNVSISDPKFRNKIVLVQLFGSWCPNCMDETAYLVPLYKKYKEKGLEIIALAYERTADYERSKRNISRLRKRFDVPYDMLITGYVNDKAEVVKSLPMLNSFIAFPTLLVIDRKGTVRKILTGFSGPGTGAHYTDFKKEFENIIDDLLLEE